MSNVFSEGSLSHLSDLRNHAVIAKRFYSNVLLVASACAVVFSLNYMAKGFILSGVLAVAGLALSFYSSHRLYKFSSFVHMANNTLKHHGM